MSDHEPISIEEARRRLKHRKGWRSLLAYLEAIEITQGIKFIVRYRSRSRTRYRVTMAAIACYAPELIKSAPKLASPVQGADVRQVREFLEHLDERIADGCAEQITRRIAPRLSALSLEMSEVRQLAGIQPKS